MLPRWRFDNCLDCEALFASPLLEPFGFLVSFFISLNAEYGVQSYTHDLKDRWYIDQRQRHSLLDDEYRLVSRRDDGERGLNMVSGLGLSFVSFQVIIFVGFSLAGCLGRTEGHGVQNGNGMVVG